MQSNYMTGDPLSLERIRSTLIRLEDTIIFGLIERAQFAHNPRIYERGGIPELAQEGVEGSWLEWFLRETEAFHARARRYTSPDEYPFTPLAELPAPLLQSLRFPQLLHPNDVNVNNAILDLYVRAIVPRVTHIASARRLGLNDTKSLMNGDARANGFTKANGNGRTNGSDSPTSPTGSVCGTELDDDGHYGSAATLDLEVLQALSKRVHYGKFVSESKFRSAPALFIAPIRARDRDTLAALITKPEVERRLLHRVRNKAQLYAQDVDADGRPLPVSAEGEGMGKIDVESVVALYEHHIIPLTKEVEVDYLLQRLDGLSQGEIDALCGTKED